MSALRKLLALTTLALLCLGYALSQVAYFEGFPSIFAIWMDALPVRAAAFILFFSAIVLGIVRKDELQKS